MNNPKITFFIFLATADKSLSAVARKMKNSSIS